MKNPAVLLCVSIIAVYFSVPQSSEAETHYLLRYHSSSGSPRELSTMRFSPDGSMLAVSTARDRLSLIRTKDGEVVKEFQSTPFSINFSQDGTRLFMISEKQRTLLDVRSGESIKFDYSAQVSKGDLGLAVEVRGGKILVKELINGGPVQTLGKITAGDEIVGAGEGRGGQLTPVLGYSLKRFLPLLQGDAGSFVQLQVIPKGQLEPAIHTLRRQAVEQKNGRQVFVPFKPDKLQENALWCLSDDKHEFSNAYTGEIISAFNPIELQDVGQVAISQDGTLFAILTKRRDREGDGIEIFSIASQERLAKVPFPGDSWYQIRFSSDSSKLLVGTWNTVEVLNVAAQKYEEALTLGWNPPDEAPRAVGVGGAVKRSVGKTTGIDVNRSQKRSPLKLLNCLAVSSQNVVATGDPFGVVRIWDMASGEKLREFATNHDNEIEGIEFSQDGKWLAFYVRGELHLVDASGMKSKAQDNVPSDGKVKQANDDKPTMSKSKVFRSSNGGEIHISFDESATETEFRKALAEFLETIKEDN